MRTLADFLRITPGLEAEDAEWLHLLVEDWHLLADLSFSDLVLWVEHEGGWVAAAHTRPMTGPMVFVEEVVGQPASNVFGDLVDRAAQEGQSEHVRERGQDLIHERARTVRRAGRTIGILSVHDQLDSGRPQTRLEEAYAEMGDDLFLMVAEGTWPHATSPSGARRGAPRVGDGVIRLDEAGRVEYASPNALSAIRQLGHPGPVEGEVLVQVMSDLPGQTSHMDEGLALVAMGRAAWRSDLETRGAAISLRAVPLYRGRTRHGAIVLVRDVSELLRRGAELMTKDQTIREIHHRVKNNLQTVAALLRMQGRRVPDTSARTALGEAERRVGVIAMIYEALSTGFAEALDFDDVAVRGLRAIVEVARTSGAIDSQLTGSFGLVRAEDATAVGLILSELVQNAVEHGIPEGGSIHVDAQRTTEDDEGDILRVTVVDDGRGLPTGFRPSRAGLGTRIVTSMVHDLGGQIRWDDAEPHGTRVRFSVRLGGVES
ncbi:sensor histidine kinase [Janibacter hoylei]|uniref:histidine kinase n=1 Tax=Janibacter hoylei PVAS-1 TaxID=1210046 RepID=K1EA83_9MICO|nr:sensor histidine kinase [Janibacter hoylei]EKA62292.1 signal transduction histidine kinase [Janibacter hoylei PVAS-1]MCT2292522.1 sensor histidine kinase [Janibacter hoylei]RWU85770.1 ATPase [Janibacter hoylei PVAS-1]